MRLGSSIVAILFSVLFLHAQGPTISKFSQGACPRLRPLSAAQVSELESRVPHEHQQRGGANTGCCATMPSFRPVQAAARRAAGPARPHSLVDENRAGSRTMVSRMTAVSPLAGPYADAANYSTVSRAWEFAAAHNPTSAPVHLNAALFLFAGRLVDAEAILARFLEADRDNHIVGATLGFLYACDILGLSGPFEVSARPTQDQAQLRAKARAALEQTDNAFVLAGAGTALPNLFPRTPAVA